VVKAAELARDMDRLEHADRNLAAGDAARKAFSAGLADHEGFAIAAS